VRPCPSHPVQERDPYRPPPTAGRNRVWLARELAGPLAPTAAAMEAGVIGFLHALTVAEKPAGVRTEVVAEMQARVRAPPWTPGHIGYVDPDRRKRTRTSSRLEAGADHSHSAP